MFKVKEQDVREVLLVDGQWHSVETGTWSPDPDPWRTFHFTTPSGEEVRGLKTAVLAVRG